MILGIDPSLRNTGVVRYDVRGTKRVVEARGTIVTAAGPDEQALADIAAELELWIDAADAVGAESQIRVQQGRAAIGRTSYRASLGREVARIVWTLCLTKQKPFIWVEPSELRSAFGLRANASKEAIRKAALSQLQWPQGEATEHEVDASGVAVVVERKLRLEAARRSA